MSKGFSIFLWVGFISVTLGVVLFSQSNGRSSDERSVGESIAKYIAFARKNDKNGAKDVISRTPKNYVESDVGENTLEHIGTNEKNSTIPSAEPLIELDYRFLTGLTFLTIGKSEPDKTIVDSIEVRGEYASAIVSFSDDQYAKWKFFLHSVDGKWTIFKIDLHLKRSKKGSTEEVGNGERMP